ncbi:MAG: T9SS type A sorting domain-containing protein [Bacteroidetes bacterium]|nr:T9SS type A sorting domain-containing protein [Bacteroidota bacterium]
MRRAFIFLLTICAANINAQVPKKIFLEHFTNTKCSVCFSKNPGLLDNLKKHPEVLFVSIHPSSPYSACPLSIANKVDNDARTNHYTIYGSTPRVVINGGVLSSSANYADTALFSAYKGISAFTIKVEQMGVGQDSIKSKISIRRIDNMAPTGNASLYVLLVEDTVFLNGGNGEKTHINVARRMLSPADGETIPLPQNLGDSLVIYKMSYRNPNWSMKRISTVAIMQELMTKTLIQSEISSKGVDFSIPSSIVNTHSESIVLIPNEAQDKIEIKGYELIENWSVLDLSGRLCLHKGDITSQSINIASLNTGVYIFKFQTGLAIESVKFVVNRGL